MNLRLRDFTVNQVYFGQNHTHSYSGNPWHIDGFMQERRNSSALAMELRLPFTKPLIYSKFLTPQLSFWSINVLWWIHTFRDVLGGRLWHDATDPSGSMSSHGFDTMPARQLVPLSKALHAALLLSTQKQMGTCEGRFVSHGAKLRVSGCILPRELRWVSSGIYMDCKGPMTR